LSGLKTKKEPDKQTGSHMWYRPFIRLLLII